MTFSPARRIDGRRKCSISIYTIVQPAVDFRVGFFPHFIFSTGRWAGQSDHVRYAHNKDKERAFSIHDLFRPYT